MLPLRATSGSNGSAGQLSAPLSLGRLRPWAEAHTHTHTDHVLNMPGSPVYPNKVRTLYGVVPFSGTQQAHGMKRLDCASVRLWETEAELENDNSGRGEGAL